MIDKLFYVVIAVLIIQLLFVYLVAVDFYEFTATGACSGCLLLPYVLDLL